MALVTYPNAQIKSPAQCMVRRVRPPEQAGAMQPCVFATYFLDRFVGRKNIIFRFVRYYCQREVNKRSGMLHTITASSIATSVPARKISLATSGQSCWQLIFVILKFVALANSILFASNSKQDLKNKDREAPISVPPCRQSEWVHAPSYSDR
jgi:hypothetical protein